MANRTLMKRISLLALFSLPFLLSTARAQTETVLYSFCAQQVCSDGEGPSTGLVFDQHGNLYGVTSTGGGGAYGVCNFYGRYSTCGTIYKVTPDGVETVLYNFCAKQQCTDGALPAAGLVFDKQGNLYGTAYSGGSHGHGVCSFAGVTGCGVVFKLTPEGQYTVLYNFCSRSNCSDGMYPSRRLVFDKQGNLYGTTVRGGDNRFCGWDNEGCGTIYKLTPEGKEIVLHNFCRQTNCTDGANPLAGLIFDKRGNMYGTTVTGGAYCVFYGSEGCGVVYKLTPKGKYTVLLTFCSANEECYDGALPEDGVILDHDGTLYGTTSEGGSHQWGYGHQWGVVFRLSAEGKETVLHNFCTQTNCTDGLRPNRITFGPGGNLYGTTWGGGAYGWGAVYKLTPDGAETILYNFCSQTNCADGAYPETGLIFDQQANMYGTTVWGDASGPLGDGVVYKITP